MGAPASFGDILKTWRKTRGLSQMDLAGRAEVSSRHLSFLETGRAGPSRDMVLRLARYLDVPLRERNAMLEAAGFSPTFRARPLDDAELAPVWSALQKLVEQHEPWGAIIADRCWRLRLANRPFLQLMELLTGPPPERLEDVNLMRNFFDPVRGIRSRVKNFDQLAPIFLEHVRADSRLPGAPAELRALEEELSDLAGELKEAEGPWLPLVPMQIDVGPMVLSLYTAVTTLSAPTDVTLAELRMETYFPADDETRAFLQAVAEG